MAADDHRPDPARLPNRGLPREHILRHLDSLREADADWRHGRVGAYVFFAGDDVLNVAKEAYEAFFSENGLSPKAFPSLGRLEQEVLEIAAGLLRGPGSVGSMTSGGTESIMVAVKTARDKAVAERAVRDPQIVLPRSAHPAFNKAAHYLGLRVVRTELADDYRADVDAMRQAITQDTILLVASAPQYPHGVIDPIREIGELGLERGIPLHIDACVGGFFLPFLRRRDPTIADFDFSVPGVMSMSADLHKFGFTAKGASTVLYRNADYAGYQRFSFTGWPIGQYASPTVTGTRPAGPIAAAWAVLHFLGEEGYLDLNDRIMAIRGRFFDGIERIPELQVWGEPVMGCFGYGSQELDMSAVANGMTQRGWYINRQADPPGIHMFVTPAHELAVEEYVEDLAAVCDGVRRGVIRGDSEAATYN